MLPITNPVKENQERGKYLKGSIRAGCEKGKGILNTSMQFTKTAADVEQINANRPATQTGLHRRDDK